MSEEQDKVCPFMSKPIVYEQYVGDGIKNSTPEIFFQFCIKKDCKAWEVQRCTVTDKVIKESCKLIDG